MTTETQNETQNEMPLEKAVNAFIAARESQGTYKAARNILRDRVAILCKTAEGVAECKVYEATEGAGLKSLISEAQAVWAMPARSRVPEEGEAIATFVSRIYRLPENKASREANDIGKAIVHAKGLVNPPASILKANGLPKATSTIRGDEKAQAECIALYKAHLDAVKRAQEAHKAAASLNVAAGTILTALANGVELPEPMLVSLHTALSAAMERLGMDKQEQAQEQEQMQKVA